MGTRSEICITANGYKVELYKHWDGYPDYMIPLFEDLRKFCVKKVKEQKHWLTYPMSVAGYLIAKDFIDSEKQKLAYSHPDIRPMELTLTGKLNKSEDTEYRYILDVTEARKWILHVYKIYRKFNEDYSKILSREDKHLKTVTLK